MIAEQLINYMVPPLKPLDDITRAKQWMDEFRVKELPIVDEGKLLGFVSEELLYDTEILHSEVGSYPLIGQSVFVAPWKHYYDILKILSENKMDVVAVVDNMEFKGVVLKDDILQEFSNTAIVNSAGAIIILQTTLKEYSLADISRIVEMNGSIVLGANVRPNTDDPSQIEIVIRINSQDVNQISNGLNKSGYTVISSFNTGDNSFDEEERYGLLMKYLNT
ncbi:MAG: CBS domain-containing protein [Cyclobacteriaceae bacterium]